MKKTVKAFLLTLGTIYSTIPAALEPRGIFTSYNSTKLRWGKNSSGQGIVLGYLFIFYKYDAISKNKIGNILIRIDEDPCIYHNSQGFIKVYYEYIYVKTEDNKMLQRIDTSQTAHVHMHGELLRIFSKAKAIRSDIINTRRKMKLEENSTRKSEYESLLQSIQQNIESELTIQSTIQNKTTSKTIATPWDMPVVFERTS